MSQKPESRQNQTGNSSAAQSNAAAAPENKMGTMPVNRLLLTMSIPMMLSMLVQALYNIVDSIFVSMISENALTAVSLAFPIQNLMIAVSIGLGVGVNALLSRSLGERRFDKVNRSASNGVFLELIGVVIFMLIGFFLTDPFYRSQTSDPEILQYGHQYMSVVCIFSLGLFMQCTFERLLQSTGKTIFTMCTQGLGAIINIIMDPILIFGLFGFPEMGVTGAAAATCLGQFIAAALAIYLNHRKNHEVRVQVRGFRPDPQTIREIFTVGIPSIIMQAIGSIMTYGMNLILISFTSTATAVFGVYFKLNSFIFMPVFGLNNGMVPIIAYNYGAKRQDRMLKALKYSVCYAVGLMTIGLVLFQVFPGFFLSLFNASENMLAIGEPALRIISISFPLAGVSIVCSSLFQSLGNGVYSLAISALRQLVVLLPVAYLLSLTGVLQSVWWSFNIAEVVALALSLFFLRRIYHKVIKPLRG